MTHAPTLSSDTLNTLKHRGLPVLAFWAVKFAVCVTKWATLRHTRRALAQLEPWQLKDMGLTPGAADTEAARAFWDA